MNTNPLRKLNKQTKQRIITKFGNVMGNILINKAKELTAVNVMEKSRSRGFIPQSIDYQIVYHKKLANLLAS